MWLSTQLEKHSEISGVLVALRRSVDKARTRTRGAFTKSSGVQLSPPSWRAFLVLLSAFGAAGLFLAIASDKLEFKFAVDLALGITTTIFVLGISITSLARSLGDSGRFAADYVSETCRMPLFCGLTLAGLLLAIAARTLLALSDAGAVYRWVSATSAGVALGACLANITGLAYVIREVVRCTSPGESSEAASSFAAAKLSWAFLKDAYLGVHVSAYQRQLEDWCLQKCAAVRPPSAYIADLVRNRTGYDVFCPSGGWDVAQGYLDCDLGRLRRLDTELARRGAQFFLAPHGWESRRGLLGRLECSDPKNRSVLRRSVLLSRYWKFRRGRYPQERDEFWEVQLGKLSLTLRRCMSDLDTDQMRQFTSVVTVPIRTLEAAWQYRQVREWYTHDAQKSYRFLVFYLDSLKQILHYDRGPGHWPDQETGKHVARFIEPLRDSIWDVIRGLFQRGDHVTLERFTFLIPRMYEAIRAEELGREPESEKRAFRNIRGKFGGFYAYSEGLFQELPEDPDGVLGDTMRNVMHAGIIRWLWSALAQDDRTLVESLASAAGRLVYAKKE